MSKAKITLTLTQEEHGTNEGMAQAIGLLTEIGVVPTAKVVLTVECENEDAESYADDMDAALSGRPMGIEVVIKTTVERHVERRKLVMVTPMDEALRTPGGQVMDYLVGRETAVSSDREPR